MVSVLEKRFKFDDADYMVDGNGDTWRKCHKITMDNGYQHVHLRGSGNSDVPTVHKLVADAFIPNPENKPEIHHIDGDPTNNRVSNLLRVTKEEHDALHFDERSERTRIRNFSRKTKAVKQTTKDGEVRIWTSAKECERETGFSANAIQKVCRGLRETAYNSTWEYVSLS